MYEKVRLILKVILGLRAILFFLFSILKIEYKPIIIHSEEAMNIISRLGGFEKDTAKGAAPFPFIMILRFKEHPMNDIRTRHEIIHHHQMIESLFLINIYSKIEFIYARYILGYNHMDSYLYQTVEQEAYLNQENKVYLKQRPIFGFWKYIFNKKKFQLINYKVVIKE